jgi:hypothetical protein
MLKSEMNEWALKAIQLETALMALDEVGLPSSMKAQQTQAENALRELFQAWLKQQPKPDTRQWKEEPAKAKGQPKDEELVALVEELKEDDVEWTLHRSSSDKGDTVETLIAEDRAWMSAGGEYYTGQWDEEARQLEVGRDDEEEEMGTGLVLNLHGELVYEPQDL